MTLKQILIPLTVPEKARDIFVQNYTRATGDTGRMLLFAGDQKVEHLNKDFYGPTIAPEAAYPHHLFEIASKGRIGVFATQLGLIARYGAFYRSIRYIVKMNAKTDLMPTKQADPISHCWNTVQQVIDLKKHSGLEIVGIGVTIYLGSEYETEMLSAAATMIYEAHQHGLITVVWMYPRGAAVQQERSAEIIAGAAGVAVCLGSDFVKVNVPDAADATQSAQLLRQATIAAGNTKVICSGGPRKNDHEFLQDVYNQIHIGGAAGAAVGRNIHQKRTLDAIKFCNALAAIIMDNVDVKTAGQLLK